MDLGHWNFVHLHAHCKWTCSRDVISTSKAADAKKDGSKASFVVPKPGKARPNWELLSISRQLTTTNGVSQVFRQCLRGSSCNKVIDALVCIFTPRPQRFRHQRWAIEQHMVRPGDQAHTAAMQQVASCWCLNVCTNHLVLELQKFDEAQSLSSILIDENAAVETILKNLWLGSWNQRVGTNVVRHQRLHHEQRQTIWTSARTKQNIDEKKSRSIHQSF